MKLKYLSAGWLGYVGGWMKRYFVNATCGRLLADCGRVFATPPYLKTESLICIMYVEEIFLMKNYYLNKFEQCGYLIVIFENNFVAVV